MDRPILFKTEMVKAILNGRKTQTRRVIKPQPVYQHRGMFIVENERDKWAFESGINGSIKTPVDHSEIKLNCPKGKVGDRLWVRETWRTCCPGKKDVYHLAYRATQDSKYEKWKPSIHMPKWACRIWLEITNIRVERVQDISEEDAKAEGVEPQEIPHLREITELMPNFSYAPHKLTFSELWDSINAEYDWEANPWVWVIEFKRLQEKIGKAVR